MCVASAENADRAAHLPRRIFKSNSAIVELAGDDHQRRSSTRTASHPARAPQILFAATKRIPEHAELGALKDRFCLSGVPVGAGGSLHGARGHGPEMQVYRDTNQKPWVEGTRAWRDFLKAHRWLALMMAREDERQTFFSDDPAWAAARPQDADARRQRLRERSKGHRCIACCVRAWAPPWRHRRARGPLAPRIPRRDERRSRPPRDQVPQLLGL